MMKVLFGYISETLPSSRAGEDDSNALVLQIQADAAANAAILLCLAIKKEAELWSSVYPKFEASNCASTFLQLLIPHILRNRLTSLAPGIMQACPYLGPCRHIPLLNCSYFWS